MPLYGNRFAGHIPNGDPRTPLTGAVGCIWPTFPPRKWRLWCTAAQGILTDLNYPGLLLEWQSTDPAHDLCSWRVISPPPAIWYCVLNKQEWNGPEGAFIYDLTIHFYTCILSALLYRPEERCNRDYLVGNLVCDYTGDQTGNDLALYQVEFNQTMPPGHY
jgi:hypothetical protein